jgi:hypothetical protein
MSTDTLDYEHIAFSAQPVDHLQAILSRLQALEERVASQDEEIARLEAVVTTQADRIAALEADQTTTTGNIEILFGLNKAVREEIKPKETTLTAKTEAHLDQIHQVLVARKGSRLDYLTFKDAEEILHLSHRRVVQLSQIAAKDPRFVIAWHHRLKNAKVFKLNPNYKKV